MRLKHFIISDSGCLKMRNDKAGHIAAFTYKCSTRMVHKRRLEQVFENGNKKGL